jgi:hypothetical protein
MDDKTAIKLIREGKLFKPSAVDGKSVQADEGELDTDTGPNTLPASVIAILERGKKLAKGGSGSGNFGHAGRPGAVGGSISDATATATRGPKVAPNPGMTEAELMARITGTYGTKPEPKAEEPKSRMPLLGLNGKEAARNELARQIASDGAQEKINNTQMLIDMLRKAGPDKDTMDMLGYLEMQSAALKSGSADSPESKTYLDYMAGKQTGNGRNIGDGVYTRYTWGASKSDVSAITAGIQKVVDEPRIASVIDKFGMPNVAIAASATASFPDGTEHPGGEGTSVIAWHTNGDDEIMTGRITMFTNNNRIAGPSSSRPMTGRQNVGNGSSADTFRHEYGHYVESQLSESQRNDWRDAYDAAGMRSTRGISDYATTNEAEGFAEVFNLVTHPGYSENAVSIDGSVDKYSRNLIGMMLSILPASKV